MGKSKLTKEHKFIKILGRGSFATVYESRNKTGEKRAIALYNHNAWERTPIKNLECEFIVKCYDFWVEDVSSLGKRWREVLETASTAYEFKKLHEVYVVEKELCTGTLRDYLVLRTSSPLASCNFTIHKCVYQIASALAYTHDKLNIIHRDLNPSNIYHVNNKDWKLAISFSSCIESDDMTPCPGTYMYMAPELWDTCYNKKADIYSFGLVILELHFDFTSSSDRLKAFRDVRKNEFVHEIRSKYSAFENWMTAVASMISDDPKERPSAKDFLKRYYPHGILKFSGTIPKSQGNMYFWKRRHVSEIESRYEFSRVLGEGVFAIVFEVVTRSGESRALKVVGRKDHTPNTLREINVLKSIDCDYIVKYHDAFVDDSRHIKGLWRDFLKITNDDIQRPIICIELGLCKGTLKQILEARDTGSLEPDIRNKMTSFVTICVEHCLRGLCYLKSLNPPITHRDVKPDNIFYDFEDRDHLNWKLGDLGNARDVGEDLTPGTGAALYAAPESLGGNYDVAIDVYSLGMVLLECCYKLSSLSDRKKLLLGFQKSRILPSENLVVNPFEGWADAVHTMTAPKGVRGTAEEVLEYYYEISL